MSETMPLNKWPVEKLYTLKYIFQNTKAPDGFNETKLIQFNQNKSMMLDIVEMAIKDAEAELAQLPFK